MVFMGRKKRGDRYKSCSRCASELDLLFRVKFDVSGQWRFVCTDCLPSIKIDNPLYIYGGTWKAQKR